jgi:hypothetical protein
MKIHTEEELLRKAYVSLGLEPGASIETINQRYRQQAMAWHPDRWPANKQKAAEEELKRIIDARDTLTDHFKRRHNSDGPCACKPAPQNTTQQTTSAEAQRSEEARKAEDARKRQEEANKAAQAAAEKQRQQKDPKVAPATEAEKEERIRWKVTACLGAAWLALAGFSWCWEHTHPYYGHKGLYLADPTPDPAPHEDPAAVKRQQEEDIRRTQEATWIKKSDEVRSAKEEIDKYQRTIDDATKRIAQLEVQLADPAPMSTTQRASLQNYQDMHKNRLSEAQASLLTAQKNLASFEANAMPPVGEVETKKKKDDDTYVTNLVIGRWQSAIDQVPTMITSVETQLAKPEVSYTEKQNLVSCRDSLRRLLSEAQENLPAAQKKLAEIGGKS